MPCNPRVRARGLSTTLLLAILLMLLVPAPRAVAEAARSLEQVQSGGGATLIRQSASPQEQRGDAALLPEIKGGFEGISKAGRMMTVRAVVANDGPPLEATLRLTSLASGENVGYQQAVDLASRARKQVVFQVPGPTATGRIELSLLARATETELVGRVVPVRVIGPTEFLVAVVTDDGLIPSGLGAIRRGGNPVAVARLTPDDLPTDALAMQSLDAIVIRQASSDRLTTDQRNALHVWIEQGGQLIVAGGPGWRRSIEGLDELLPVDGLWTRPVKHLRSFARYAGVQPPDGDVLVTLGSPVEGARVLLTQESIPLIVERWIGIGRVTFVGVDPALEPFRSWPGAESVWQRILVGGRPGLPTLEVGSMSGSPLRGALSEMLDLGLVPAVWIGLFLLMYVLVAGPGQYLLLRRLDRREWAWIGFPLIAVSSAGFLLVGAAWSRGPDIRLAAISVVRVGEDARSAAVDTFVGMVAPARGSYDLAFLDGGVPRPLSDIGTGGVPVIIESDPGGQPTRLPGLRFEGRVPREIQLRALTPAPAPILAELRTTNGRLEGRVRNVSGERLEDAIIIAAGEAIGLGDLAPGDSRPVSISLPTNRAAGAWQNGPPPWAVPGARPGADRRRQLINQIVQPTRGSDGESTGGVTLLAWTSATPPRVSLGSDRVAGSARRLLEQSLPVDYGTSDVAIPPGLIGRAILDGAILSRGGGQSFVARGTLVFQYDLPPGLELSRLDRLSVHFATPQRSGQAPTPPRISLYRWADRTWVDVPMNGTGVSNLTFGASFVDAGTIRLRLEPQGSELQVDQLDLSLEGVRS